MILTTGYVDHAGIQEYLGVVTANVVSGIGFTSDMVAAVKDFTGGRVTDYERALNDAKASAMSQIESSANAMNADAVMGIRFDVTVFSPHGKGTMIGVTVYGTAIKLARRQTAEQMPSRGFTAKPRLGFAEAMESTEHKSNAPHMGAGFEWGK